MAEYGYGCGISNPDMRLCMCQYAPLREWLHEYYHANGVWHLVPIADALEICAEFYAELHHRVYCSSWATFSTHVATPV